MEERISGGGVCHICVAVGSFVMATNGFSR